VSVMPLPPESSASSLGSYASVLILFLLLFVRAVS
jgi:hypothetical protein